MSDQIIQLLVAERDRLERAIEALQGSPQAVDVYEDTTMPDWVRPASKKTASPPKKKGFSAATRRRMAEGQKRRWAAINAAKAEAAAPKKRAKAIFAEAIEPKEDTEFKSKMSIAMAKSWAARRKKATKKKAA